MLVSLFFFLYLILSNDFTFVFPIAYLGTRSMLASPCVPTYRCISFFLQLVFVISCVAVATSWIQSLAPFLDATSQKMLPSFVWPTNASSLAAAASAAPTAAVTPAPKLNHVSVILPESLIYVARANISRHHLLPKLDTHRLWASF